MSFQAYLDTIREKTGKGPDDFRKLAEKRGLLRADVKAAEVVAWLKSEFGLGHGHAMAIYSTLRAALDKPTTKEDDFEAHFKGDRAAWKPVYAKLLKSFGKDAPSVKAGGSYISLLHGSKKFAIVKVGVDFLDIGIKFKGAAPKSARLATSGSWNAMVTHRVRLNESADFDKEIVGWLKAAYDSAGESSASTSARKR